MYLLIQTVFSWVFRWKLKLFRVKYGSRKAEGFGIFQMKCHFHPCFLFAIRTISFKVTCKTNYHRRESACKQPLNVKSKIKNKKKKKSKKENYLKKQKQIKINFWNLILSVTSLLFNLNYKNIQVWISKKNQSNHKKNI